MKLTRMIGAYIVPLAMIVATSFFCSRTLQAQEQSPIALLSTVIKQLQDGHPDPSLFGDQLQRTIAEQTNHSGQYMPLAALGPVTAINVTRSQEYPSGQLYSINAAHLYGNSSWTLGVNSISKRVEYANFSVFPVGADSNLPPQAPPISPNPPASSFSAYPSVNSSVYPPITSAVKSPCSKYPSLC
jgi:hypothetical protein